MLIGCESFAIINAEARRANLICPIFLLDVGEKGKLTYARDPLSTGRTARVGMKHCLEERLTAITAVLVYSM
jgi:hypothetical protein